MTCKKEKEEYSPIKCYYCGCLISDYDELAYLNVDLLGKNKKTVQRAVHYYCVPKIKKSMKMENKLKEVSDWDKCYNLFKEWKGLGSKNLDNYSVQRLLGLRINKFTPKGNNTLGLKSGYDFDVIFATMQFVNRIITNAKRTMTFSDNNHETNYFMKIIIREIDFMANKIAIKKQEEERLEMQIQNIEYQEDIKNLDLSTLKQKDNNELVSSLLDDVAEMDDNPFDEVF